MHMRRLVLLSVVTLQLSRWRLRRRHSGTGGTQAALRHTGR